MKNFSFSGSEEFKLVRKSVSEYLNSKLPKNDAFFTNVVINEAVNNVILHAQCYLIELLILIKEDKVLIKVKDDGKGFNGNEEIKKIRETNKDLFKDNLYGEGQRGLLLMEKICDEVKYNDKGNELLLVKELYKNNKYKEIFDS